MLIEIDYEYFGVVVEGVDNYFLFNRVSDFYLLVSDGGWGGVVGLFFFVNCFCGGVEIGKFFSIIVCLLFFFVF